MGFWRDKEMEELEDRLQLQGEYREDQSGYPWIANRAFRPKEDRSSSHEEIDPKWFNAPGLAQDWQRMHWNLCKLLKKHPELLQELDDYNPRECKKEGCTKQVWLPLNYCQEHSRLHYEEGDADEPDPKNPDHWRKPTPEEDAEVSELLDKIYPERKD